jgi:hypothetical protein
MINNDYIKILPLDISQKFFHCITDKVHPIKDNRRQPLMPLLKYLSYLN